MSNPFRFFWVSILCLAASALLVAQQAPSPTPQVAPIIHSTRGEVVFDMVVTDKHGRIVSNLKPDDIQVLDNNAPQKIESFHAVAQSVHLTAADLLSAGITPSSINQQQLPTFNLVSIVFGSMDTGSRALARMAAESYIQKDLGPNDYVAIYDIDMTVYVLQSFTRDRAKLKTAIDVATGGRSSTFKQMNEDVQKQVTQAITALQQIKPPTSGPGAGAAAGAAMGALAQAKMDQMVADEMTAAANADTTDASRLTISALTGIVQGQQRLPGRKSVIYFTQNMPVNSNTAYLFHQLIDTANRSQVSFYMVDPSGLNLESDNAQSTSMLRQAEGVSAGEGATGRAVSMSEANNSELTENIQYSSRHMMQSLASSTGGFYVGNTNDLRPQMARVEGDISEHYEISYAPSTGDDGKFHDITIKLTRPDLLVRARSGYYALPPMKEAVLGYEAPIFAVLNQTPAPADFQVNQSQLVFPASPQKQTVDAALEFPLKDFKFSPVKLSKGEGVSAHFTAMLLVEAMDGSILHKESHDFPILGKAGLEQRRMIFERQFDLPPGVYHLKSVIFEPDTKKATVQTILLSVPAVTDGQIRLSSIAIVGSTEHGASVSNPLSYQNVKIVPDISEPLVKGKTQQVGFFFRVYPPKGSKPQLIIAFKRDGKIVGKAGEPLPAPQADGSVPVLAGFPLAGFPAGQYEADVVVLNGQQNAMQAAFFTVQ